MKVGAIVETKCSSCGKVAKKYFSYTGETKCSCGGLVLEVTSGAEKCNLVVDQTLGYYDKSLGVYIESTSDRRKIMRERNLETFSRYDELTSARDSVERDRKEESANNARRAIESCMDRVRR